MEKALYEILAVGQAAVLLHIPRSSVCKLVQLGKIPTQKVGLHRRFQPDTLVDWIAVKNCQGELNSE